MGGNQRLGGEGSRRLSILLLALIIAASAGCASTPEEHLIAESSAKGGGEEGTGGESEADIEPTVVAHRDYRDPLIGINRAVFAFNDVSYRYLLIPLGKGYVEVTPEPVQQSVGNFFDNLQAPIYLANNLLQWEPKAAGTNLLRFGINTTVGLLGLFDPAERWFDLKGAASTFEDTLAFYGAGYGFYVVLPFLGPSDLRNGASALTEGVLHPVSYISEDSQRILIQGFDYFQEFAPEAERYEDVVEESEDPYIFTRNLYLQGVQRDAESQRD